MIRFFPSSRKVALWGSIVSGVLSAGLIWSLYPGERQFKIVLILLVWILFVNMAVYIAKLIAVRKHRELLLLLYEKHQVREFLRQAVPLLDHKANLADYITHAVHVANAYLVQGKTEEALRLLQSQVVPKQKLELQGLLWSNLSSAYLQQGDMEEAKKLIRELEQLVKRPECKQAFNKKIRHVIAYQNLCLEVLNGRYKGKEVLEKDFETSPSMVHKMSAGRYLLKIYEKTNETDKSENIREYMRANIQ